MLVPWELALAPCWVLSIVSQRGCCECYFCALVDLHHFLTCNTRISILSLTLQCPRVVLHPLLLHHIKNHSLDSMFDSSYSTQAGSLSSSPFSQPSLSLLLNSFLSSSTACNTLSNSCRSGPHLPLILCSQHPSRLKLRTLRTLTHVGANNMLTKSWQLTECSSCVAYVNML